MLAELEIVDWDLLLVGDGSGSGWAGGCGWAYVLIDRLTRGRRDDCGGMSAGSINLAELMPYLQAMTYYHANHGRERLKARGLLNVHVITDSQVIFTHGRQASLPTEPLPKVQRELWAAMRAYTTAGYHFTFHWARRSTSLLNWYTDLLAAVTRKSVMRARGGNLSPTDLRGLRRTAMLCQLALEQPDSDLRAALQGSLGALKTLLDASGSQADRTAAAIETAQIVTPDGEPISIYDLNHDEPPEPDPPDGQIRQLGDADPQTPLEEGNGVLPGRSPQV